MKIPEIRTTDIMISDVGIRELNIPPIRTVFDGTAPLVPAAPPVVLEVGLPVVDIPGCVEAHEKSDKNENLLEDDPKGTKTFCDGQTPSFDPIQYEPERLVPTNIAPVPKTESPEKPAPEVPKAPEVKPPPINTAKIDCPTREQELKNPVGKILKGNEKITGYELVGKECLMVTEKLSIPDQIVGNIPNAGAVTTTASIAVVATTSALVAKPLADLLLRVVKPTVKKIIKKIAAIRGKKTAVESVKDRRDQQRLYSHALRKLKGKE
tara:strand:+ start:815 stop:1612 length:798 start_codon:yes stop_codon:yes gene_type:complete